MAVVAAAPATHVSDAAAQRRRQRPPHWPGGLSFPQGVGVHANKSIRAAKPPP
jgi:hypothetical protein